MNHPWIAKEFSGPPENYLPHRAPLELPLDMNVINIMTSFDFGNPSQIHDKIKNALSSDDRPTTPSTPKRASSLYKKRNSSHSSLHKAAQIADVGSPTSSSSKDMSEAMISIYYLARERMEREARNGQTSSHSNAIKSTAPVASLAAQQLGHARRSSESQNRKSVLSDANAIMSAEPPTGSRRTRSLGEARRESIRERRAREGAEGQKEENTEIDTNSNSTAGLLVASTAGSQVSSSTKPPSTAKGIVRRLSTQRRRLPPENPPRAAA